MPGISTRRVRRYLTVGQNGIDTTSRGRALEDLICYVFGALPGVEIVERNALNNFATEEVDVAVWNNRHSAGLHFMPNVFLIECKNWSRAVGSQEVAYFASRLRHRGCDHGVLIAAHGITGVPEELTGARY